MQNSFPSQSFWFHLDCFHGSWTWTGPIVGTFVCFSFFSYIYFDVFFVLVTRVSLC